MAQPRAPAPSVTISLVLLPPFPLKKDSLHVEPTRGTFSVVQVVSISKRTSPIPLEFIELTVLVKKTSTTQAVSNKETFHRGS